MAVDNKMQTMFSEWGEANVSVDPTAMQGKYINARSTLIAAGPPSFSQVANGGNANDAFFPIGFIESFGIAQQKNIQRMYEIGSNRAYFVPGRTISSANFGRVLFHGPSLLRVLYAYYPSTKITKVGTGVDDVKVAFTDADDCLPFIPKGDEPGTITPKVNCGEGEGLTASFYMNLASSLFDHPLGLLVYMKDIAGRYYSGMYLEYCHITAHSFNINASSTVIAEGVGMQFDSIVPVDLSGS